MSQNRAGVIGRSVSLVRARRRSALHLNECLGSCPDFDDDETGGCPTISFGDESDEIGNSQGPEDVHLHGSLVEVVRYAVDGDGVTGQAPTTEMPEIASDLILLSSLPSNFGAVPDPPDVVDDFAPHDWEDATTRVVDAVV